MISHQDIDFNTNLAVFYTNIALFYNDIAVFTVPLELHSVNP